MTKRLDDTGTSSPSTVSSTSNDPLSTQLTEIFKERQALQLRTQELERMVQKKEFPCERLNHSSFDLGS